MLATVHGAELFANSEREDGSMNETPNPAWRPGQLVRDAGPRLAIFLGILVVGAWLLIDVVLGMQLTRVLSDAISVTGAEWIMYLLIGLSVLSVGVTIERWLFSRVRAIDVESLRTQLARLLRDGRHAEAGVLAENLPAMERGAVAACLDHLDQGSDTMEREMTAVLGRERLRYERYLIILGTLGNSAPFIGLFGTVLGIIKAFMDLAQDIAGGAAVVMAGISEALVATALGLFVAIPSVIAYNVLKARVRAIGTNAEYLAHVVIAHGEAQHGERME